MTQHILQLITCRAAESIVFSVLRSVPDRNTSWIRAEDDLLVEGVGKCSTSNILGHSWIEVPWEMPGRLTQQCQERYRLAHICAELYSHPHKFRVFFHNRTTLREGSTSPMTCSVSDGIVAFTPAPNPRSRCSLSHEHKFRVFFRNRTVLWVSSVIPTTSHREVSGMVNELPEESDQFCFLRPSCFANLKGVVGLIMTKGSTIWISIPLDLSSRSCIPLPSFIRSCRPTPLPSYFILLVLPKRHILSVSF